MLRRIGQGLLLLLLLLCNSAPFSTAGLIKRTRDGSPPPSSGMSSNSAVVRQQESHHKHDHNQVALMPSAGRFPSLAVESKLQVTNPNAQQQRPSFEAMANSVGLLLTSHKGEAMHLWMPLGKKVFTRDEPALPLHPHTARITTLITTSPRLAAPEQLNRIQCDLWTANQRTARRGKGRAEKWKVSFSKLDGLVKFAGAEGPAKRFWLGGKEVESIQCS